MHPSSPQTLRQEFTEYQVADPRKVGRTARALAFLRMVGSRATTRHTRPIGPEPRREAAARRVGSEPNDPFSQREQRRFQPPPGAQAGSSAGLSQSYSEQMSGLLSLQS